MVYSIWNMDKRKGNGVKCESAATHRDSLVGLLAPLLWDDEKFARKFSI
jgi:hypothetical protein